MLKNTTAAYGLVSIILHWLVAVAVFGLFAVGFWMVDLSYYSQWYHTAPYWHKSVGILLAIVMVLRLMWRLISPPPKPLATIKRWEQSSSVVVHFAMYLLILLLVLSGYLISAEDGRPIPVFNWFSVPSVGEMFSDQADIAGILHEYLAYSVMALALLHALAALKHHFIDKDHTLKRMFGRKR